MTSNATAEQQTFENANEMRTDSRKLSKAHARVKLRQLADELARLTAKGDLARSKARRAIKRSWNAEDAVKRLERRIAKFKAEMSA